MLARRRRGPPASSADAALTEALALSAALAKPGPQRQSQAGAPASSQQGRLRAPQPVGRPAKTNAAPGATASASAAKPGDTDEEDIFGADDLDDEDGADILERGLAELLGEQAVIDEGLSELAQGLLISPIERGDLMEIDVAVEGDNPMPDPLAVAAARASVAMALGAEQLSGTGPAAAASDLGQAVEGLEAIVDMAMGLSCLAGAGQEAEPSGSATSSSAGEAALQAQASDAPAQAQGEQQAPAAVGVAIAGGPPGWAKTDRGYVFDQEGRHRGRITTWGRNVSCKRTEHECSKAKGRSKVTDGQLAFWLAQGLAEFSTGDTMAQMRCGHEAAFTF